jgi:hypothetical protein
MVDPEDAVTRPLPHPTKLRFVWHSRFYTAVLDRDLFDQWTVIRSWGSTKSGQGGGRVSVVESFEAGLALLQAIRRRRERYGYKVDSSRR